MTFSVSSPVTGAAQTGFTAPTYTVTTDTYPNGQNGKQYAVTALGGTQTGVRTHAVSDPFTVAGGRPTSLRSLPALNGNGGYSSIPRNVYFVTTRKGVNIAANQPTQIATMNCRFDIPAGADSYDAANLRALVSLGVGTLSQQASGIGDMIVSGIL